jgi:tetratricopeptide (TPR) repeat protein
VSLTKNRSAGPADRPVASLTIVLLIAVMLTAGSGCQMAANGYNMEGVRLSQQGNHQAALAKFQKAMKTDPKNADAFYNLAATYHQMGKLNNDPNMFSQAESYYHQCLDQNENHTDCRRALAALLVDTGRSETAFSMLNKWAAASPHVPDPHIELARLYEEFGDKEKAGRELDQAIAMAPLAPQTARAWAARGRLREKSGDHAQALANYHQAYQANRFHPGVSARIAALQQGTAGGTTATGDTRVVTQPNPPPRY